MLRWLAWSWLGCAPLPAAAPVATPTPAPTPEPTPAVWLPDGAAAPTERLAATELRVADRELAVRLRREARQTPFETLVRQHSTAPSAPRGGRLGAFAPGTFHPRVEAALAATPVGGLAQLVQTEAGVHLLRRDALDERVVRWVRIAWTGARGAAVERDEAAADTMALTAEARLGSGAMPSSIEADLAGPDDGTRLGRDQWDPVSEAAVWSLAVGETTRVETPAGWLVAVRLR